MSAKDFAFIGMRLLAIYLALNVIYSIAGMAEAAVALTTGAFGAEVDKPAPFVYYGFISTFLNLFFAVLLWIGAERLVHVVVPAKMLPASREHRRSIEFQAIAFSAVGLLILVNALPKIGGELYKAYLIAHSFDIQPQVSLADKARYVQVGLQALFGLMLLIWGAALSGLLLWFRELGVATKTSNHRLKSDPKLPPK
jgi:hypothetical protein